MKRTKLLSCMVLLLCNLTGTAQTENPRGIYKMMTVDGNMGLVNAHIDQYKILTDSVTMNIVVYDNYFTFSKNQKVYDYTGKLPDDTEEKSEQIYDSDDKHFTLKWWAMDYGTPAPINPSNGWCIEHYQSGQFTANAKLVFETIMSPSQTDKQNPLFGTWRVLGILPNKVSEEAVSRLKEEYPQNERLYNRCFYIFTPSHIFNISNREIEGMTRTLDYGVYCKAKYMGKESVNDGTGDYPITWISENLLYMAISPKDSIQNVVMERATDNIPVYDRIAYWYVDRDFSWYLEAARTGNAESQFRVAMAYLGGKNVEKDVEKGMEWLRKSAEGGNKYAQYTLGYAHLIGDGVEKDVEKAYSWLLKAAEKGVPAAQFMVGCYYIDGMVVERDMEKAFEWMEESANREFEQAQLWMGYYYNQQNKYDKALFYFLKATEKGNAEAQNEVGVMYANGQGTEKDEAKAIEWYRKSAEQGYALAQSNLAYRYDNGDGVEKDTKKAFELYLKAAEGGDASAQNNVAWKFYTADGVEQDYDKAFYWAKKSVEGEDPYGYGTLGELYYKGCGVAKDKIKAFELYSKGAELGDTESMRMVAIMYKKGEGTKKDKDKAAYWQKKYEENKNK